jgi:hypothetical protein
LTFLTFVTRLNEEIKLQSLQAYTKINHVELATWKNVVS